MIIMLLKKENQWILPAELDSRSPRYASHRVAHRRSLATHMTPATATGDPPFRRELSRARSRLYGYLRQREQAHFFTFFEIYKILIPLHRSTLKYLSIFRFYFCNFFHQISSFFANFESISSVFEQILMKFCRNFAGLKNYSQNFGEISNFDAQGVRGLPKKLK